MRLLLLFLATAVFLGCRDAVQRRRGIERTSPRWPLLVFSMVVALGFLSQRLLD